MPQSLGKIRIALIGKSVADEILEMLTVIDKESYVFISPSKKI
jgi:hypothetical protein